MGCGTANDSQRRERRLGERDTEAIHWRMIDYTESYDGVVLDANHEAEWLDLSLMVAVTFTFE